MINRVLIRIKVVQMLYSYLLVENRFTLEDMPEPLTREKRFAYRLYLDMLALIVEISEEIKQRGGYRPLYETRFVRRIAIDDKIRSIILRTRTQGGIMNGIAAELAKKVKSSTLYKKFLKSENPDSPANEQIWPDLFETLIVNDPELNRVISGMEGYTLAGVDRMREMMEKTFSNFFVANDNIPDALGNLRKSMDKARELYIRLLELPILLTSFQEGELENNRTKFMATAADRNPDYRFVENQLVERLRNDEQLQKAIDSYSRTIPSEEDLLLRSLLKAITASEYYKEYMNFPATDFRMDCELWRNLFKNVIFENPDFLESLESKSVFWNDDLDIIGDFVLKTIRKISEESRVEESQGVEKGVNSFLMPMYKDEEDASFGSELFEFVVRNKDIYRVYINDALDNSSWEADRLAYLDVVVMMTALAEILNFPKIPLNVSLNEYIEIAKAYSTTKSGQFVNGLLGVIIKNLREEKKLIK